MGFKVVGVKSTLNFPGIPETLKGTGALVTSSTRAISGTAV